MASQLVKIRNIKRALGFDLSKAAGNAVNCIISGRVKSVRVMKARNFIDLIDGSTNEHLQVVIKKDVLKKISIGSYITCQGNLVKSPGGKQTLEFDVEKVCSLGACNPSEYPLMSDRDQTSDGWYRKQLHLRPREPHFSSLLRIQSELSMGLHMIMRQMDFFHVRTPTFTSNDSEANSDLFSVQRYKVNHFQNQQAKQTSQDSLDNSSGSSSESESDFEQYQRMKSNHFFKKHVFLTTSAQLHLESLAASLSRVYCSGPVFRAEHSLGSRHLCEFTMLEAEEANVDRVDELMDRVETIIKFISQYLSEISEYKSDLNHLLDRYSHRALFDKIAHSKYIRMSYCEALSILEAKSSSIGTMKFGKDINKTHENILLEHCDNIPIFITDYPQFLKPFYMKLSNSGSTQKTVACFDLIAPLGGEICGGSLREDNLDILKANLEHNCSSNDILDRFNWYIQLREFGSFPHGGFGIGIERLTKALLGIRNIKDTIPFPRWPGNCSM